MKFTICKSFVKVAKKPNKYTSILNYFPMENADSVVYNKKIISSYFSIANSRIRDWIKLMDKTKSWSKIADFSCEEEDLFIEACTRTHDKSLIVSEKEVYTVSKYTNLTLLLDKDEARVNFSQTGTTNSYTITGDNPVFTTGANSGIENGE